MLSAPYGVIQARAAGLLVVALVQFGCGEVADSGLDAVPPGLSVVVASAGVAEEHQDNPGAVWT